MELTQEPEIGAVEQRKLEKDKQLSASQRAARAREIAKKETEKLFGKTDEIGRAHV